MGKITGFMEFDRQDRHYRPVEERVKHWQEFVEPLPPAELKKQAARCMDCGIPYCHNGCPVNNQIPDWNDLVFRERWKVGGAQPALHQQLPRGDGARVPGAVRGLLHAQHRRQPGHHQDHRVRHRRPGLRGRLGRAAAGRAEDRQEGRHRRLRPGRPRRRPAARARRPRGARLREERQARRSPRLRHPRLQAGEAHRRPAREADGGRGRRLPLQRARRQDHLGDGAEGHARRAAAGGRLRAAVRLLRQGAGARPRRPGVRHDVPAAAEPPRRGRAAEGRAADHGRGQARHRHRRRRHGQRLHRHLVPPGRQVGDAAGDHADAAAEGEQGARPGRTGR